MLTPATLDALLARYEAMADAARANDWDRLATLEREAFEARLESVQKRYSAQFTALDSTIASMTQTSNYLTQQLASLSSFA